MDDGRQELEQRVEQLIREQVEEEWHYLIKHSDICQAISLLEAGRGFNAAYVDYEPWTIGSQRIGVYSAPFSQRHEEILQPPTK